MCIHEEIADRARQNPSKGAICSWDGNFTYAELDEYSTSVAADLQQKGIRLNDFVAVCFEKSKWAAVATLGVMKAGATFVMMDPALPLARLQNMVAQVKAKAVLASRSQIGVSASLTVPEMTISAPLVIESDTFATEKQTNTPTALAKVDPKTLMYIIFTSGSTGTSPLSFVS
jgi:acyl-CoA synthetase (AMP-forming)/AMP-acid ligase II